MRGAIQWWWRGRHGIELVEQTVFVFLRRGGGVVVAVVRLLRWVGFAAYLLALGPATVFHVGLAFKVEGLAGCGVFAGEVYVLGALAGVGGEALSLVGT